MANSRASNMGDAAIGVRRYRMFDEIVAGLKPNHDAMSVVDGVTIRSSERMHDVVWEAVTGIDGCDERLDNFREELLKRYPVDSFGTKRVAVNTVGEQTGELWITSKLPYRTRS